MRVASAAILLALLSLVPISAQQPPATALDEVLKAMAMTRADLHFKPDLVPRDAFRLALVDKLMDKPLDAPSVTKALAAQAWQQAAHLSTLVGWAGSLLELPTVVPEPAQEEVKVQLPLTSDLPPGATPDAVWSEMLSRVPPLGELARAVQVVREQVQHAFAQLSAEDRAWLAEHAGGLASQDGVGEADLARIRDLATKVDRAALVSAATTLATALQSLEAVLPSTVSSPWPWKADGVVGASGDVIAAYTDASGGRWIIGGRGRTEYSGDFDYIIDLGGDDVYLGRAAAASPEHPVSFCLDLSGDDCYLNTSPFSQGCGLIGAGILIDVSGRDMYRGGVASQGAGIFGVGVLADQGGNDDYNAFTHSQGAGIFGVGILLDGEGNDSYRARVNSQAYSEVWGVGLLMEAAGNDVYYAAGEFYDFREPKDATVSLSQGFSIGQRPDASGGVALLADKGGNDVYVGDYFAQGSSYWYGLGCLVDENGFDKYVARRYSQGAGIHLSVGVLLDYARDDNYVSWGVSQGCGHDLGPGILVDYAGNDTYTSSWLSQGAGNENGLGMLVDLGGNDHYVVQPGGGQPIGVRGGRGYGSIGLLLDIGGQDTYSLDGADNTVWVHGEVGGGIDTDSLPAGYEF